MSTDAKREANRRYLGKQDSITIRTPDGTKDRWKESAEVMGKSLNQLIVEAVEKEIGNKKEAQA